MRLQARQTNGAIGLVEAGVPAGSGPVPHTRATQDETFYMLSGELEFLDGDKTFIAGAGAGDVVHIPRRVRHRFRNVGVHTAKMIFSYTPGGTEGIFVEGGGTPVPGVQVQAWGPERFDERMMGFFANAVRRVSGHGSASVSYSTFRGPRPARTGDPSGRARGMGRFSSAVAVTRPEP